MFQVRIGGFGTGNLKPKMKELLALDTFGHKIIPIASGIDPPR